MLTAAGVQAATVIDTASPAAELFIDAPLPAAETTGGGWVLDAQFDRIMSGQDQLETRSLGDDAEASHERLGKPWWRRSAGARRGLLPGVRLDPGRRTAAAVGVAALLAALIAGGWLFVDRARVGAVVATGTPPGLSSPLSMPSATSSPGSLASGTSTRSGTASLSGAAGRAASAGNAASNQLVVDVVGLVVRPGIYQLAVGSRVADALTAAGGALPGVNLTVVNLARRLNDGEQVAIGVPAATDAAGVSAGGGAGGGAGGSLAGTSQPLVDLNTATLEQLDALPGVGPVLAQRILDWRSSHGRFASIDQLRQVSGIGAAKYADIRALVTI